MKDLITTWPEHCSLISDLRRPYSAQWPFKGDSKLQGQFKNMASFWPWHFVSLSQEEVLQRRELLDLRGAFAQWSAMLGILVIRVVYQGWKSASQIAHRPKAPRGPVSWWDRPPVAGWLETRRHYAACGLWLTWLFGLCVWNSGDGTSHILILARFYSLMYFILITCLLSTSPLSTANHSQTIST